MKKKIVLLVGVAAAVWGVKKMISGGSTEDIIEPYVQPQQPEDQIAA